MIYDPKKPIEQPPPVKDSHRVRDGFSVQARALSAGECRGCQRPYRHSDEVVEFTPLGKTEATETWHPDCWKRSNRDFFDRPQEWPWK